MDRSNYTELSFIQSSGMQAINSEYYANSNSRIIIDYQFVGATNNFQTIVCSRDGAPNYLNTIALWGNTSYSSMSFEQSYYHNTPLLRICGFDFNRHVVDMNKNLLYFDEKLILSNTLVDFTCNYPLYAFRSFTNGELEDEYGGIFKLYSWKIYENDILVRNFIPAKRNSDSEIGLYDTVTDQFYTNCGEGEFTGGIALSEIFPTKQLLSRYLVDKVVKKIDKEYVILDFIESSGEQYIDTGYIPNGNTRVRCKGQILGTASASSSGDSFVAYGSAISYNDRSFEFYIDKGEYKANYAGIVGRFSPASINDIIEIDHDKNAISITLNDQTTHYTINSSVVQFTAPVSMYIFASHRPSMTFGGKQRMYYFEIYENGICYRKYIPAMKINTGEVGFYDVISNVFYQNSGTGSFVPGNIQHYIVKHFSTNDYEYDELDYINFISSNKKPVYYDTNTKPSNSFIIKTTFKMDGVTQDYGETTRSAIFGSRGTNSFCLFYYDNRLRFDFSNNKQYYPFSKNEIKETDLYEIERNGNIVTFTDVSTNQTKTIELANSDFSIGKNFYIGSIAGQNSEADSDGFKGYFYKTELWKNSTTLLKDLRPCRRNSDGAIGFYDTLSETFLENKGTGLVEAGKVIGHFGNVVPTENYEKNVPASCKFLASRLGVTPSSNTLDKSVLNANLLKKVIYTFKPGEVFQSSDLTKMTWEQIRELSDKLNGFNKNEAVEKYSPYIGSVKSVDLGPSYGIHNFVLADICHDIDQNEKPILTTWICKDIVALHEFQYATKDTSPTGSTTHMTFLNTTLRNNIESDLKSVMVKAVKETTMESSSVIFNDNKPLNDYLWIPTVTELNSPTSATNKYGSDGYAYPIFTDDASRIKRYNGSAHKYWTRTLIDFDYVLYVNSSGRADESTDDRLFIDNGIVPCFCV